MVIINSGYRGRRDFPRVPKPVVMFYQAMKTFVTFLPGYQNFLPQILQSMIKLASMISKSLQKSKSIEKARNYYSIYFIHIYYELITILFMYCTHLHIYIWNQFMQHGITLLRGFPTQFQEIKENY